MNERGKMLAKNLGNEGNHPIMMGDVEQSLLTVEWRIGAWLLESWE